MTSVAAQHFALVDRGLQRLGMAADLVLCDPATEDRTTFDRPTELATGVVHLWVAGEVAMAESRPTCRRPGRVLG